MTGVETNGTAEPAMRRTRLLARVLSRPDLVFASALLLSRRHRVYPLRSSRVTGLRLGDLDRHRPVEVGEGELPSGRPECRGTAALHEEFEPRLGADQRIDLGPSSHDRPQLALEQGFGLRPYPPAPHAWRARLGRDPVSARMEQQVIPPADHYDFERYVDRPGLTMRVDRGAGRRGSLQPGRAPSRGRVAHVGNRLGRLIPDGGRRASPTTAVLPDMHCSTSNALDARR